MKMKIPTLSELVKNGIPEDFIELGNAGLPFTNRVFKSEDFGMPPRITRESEDVGLSGYRSLPEQ
ncbi:hypothetical protein H9L17_09585 [Thermomonas brevis]|uniref:Uncharacterized protein n=1 Tax=Thermomonas brevis TaxID=215691 RepID=A0A7G9QQ54_9GAMM|nr:hypothetical protein [Thermomonas brevis]QNN45479.1 hypothetical protein H9L17_09585 [Thermomonas brevis]